MYKARLTLYMFLMCSIFSEPANAGNPSALWDMVSRICVHEQRQQGARPHCAEVDTAQGLEQGFAVLKDSSPHKPFEYLLIPTVRISGIEDPRLLETSWPNYFDDAWQARRFIAESLGVSPQWDMVALAINSMQDRSQDQLHIHIDCIRADIRATLKRNEPKIGPRWVRLDLPPPDHPYMILRLDKASLASTSPFQLVARDLLGAADHMGTTTIVVVGGTFDSGRNGFYLLASQAGPSVSAHGEDLIDPTCSVAKP